MTVALDTHSLNMAISDIIDNAKTRLVIISPYLSIYQNLRRSIELADNRGVNIILIYRNVDEKSDVIGWITSLKHIYLGQSDNLHAKYYGEDKGAVITSMNLYEYSQVNNEELGILIDDKQDNEAFSDLLFFVKKIIELSTPVYATIKCEFYEGKKILSKTPGFKFSMLKTPVNNTLSDKKPKESLLKRIIGPKIGFCIRCGKSIDINSDTYYCEECYSSWKRYKNPNYKEKYCHICGKQTQTSAYRPVCSDCFPRSTDIINRKKDIVLKDRN